MLEFMYKIGGKFCIELVLPHAQVTFRERACSITKGGRNDTIVTVGTRAIFVTKTKTRTIAIRSLSTKTRTITN